MNTPNYKVCPDCGNKMFLKITSRTFRIHGKEIEIRGINTYKCVHCGEEVFTASEARMIDRLVRAVNERPEPELDVLNLNETAKYLRVSNQTVYNMIRNGRIKAYKAGREWRFLKSDIIAYMDSTANEGFLSMAAKGGQIDPYDAQIIDAEIKKRKSTDE